MSKFKRNKKKTAQTSATDTKPKTTPRKLTPEEAAAIVKDRLANRPVIIWRYRNGKLNTRFIVTLAIMIVAMIAAVYFFTRAY